MLLDHARRSPLRGHLDQPDKTLTLHNPLCGDEVTVELSEKNGSISDARISGSGCMISQAAASLLVQGVKGRSKQAAKELIEHYRAMLLGKQVADESVLGDLLALEGVKKYPVRIKCALLPYDVLNKLFG
jgi:nitrogen fixation protein NifU and related proteins